MTASGGEPRTPSSFAFNESDISGRIVFKRSDIQTNTEPLLSSPPPPQIFSSPRIATLIRLSTKTSMGFDEADGEGESDDDASSCLTIDLPWALPAMQEDLESQPNTPPFKCRPILKWLISSCLLLILNFAILFVIFSILH
eukprot:Gregarina_sp_Poly_1__9668@NODE_612_length_7140_cov_89_373533_g468_i0_p2_GENE_NODE_612_length_7140_cov_89_373533_g468_i0NODE_612_length_7140_cov_89_373533_g468_i0_p2_ORF_typecomplete_len141_score18_33_NODE_612_length_7140_cov_89_373533_g468_i063736795